MLTYTPSVPLMTLQKFSELVGVRLDVVRGWADKHHIPTRKIGRHRLVDVAALSQVKA